jgi:hypothetical protein
MKSIQTARFSAGITAALLAASNLMIAPAFAHEAPCPYCGQTITQETKEQDNETVLKIGRKRIEYKCVFCALAEAKTEYKGDLSILAPSEKKGEPIKLERKDGKWTASAEGVRFAAQKGSHKVCQVLYRAFTTEDSAKAYIEKHKAHLADAKPLTLAQMLEMSGAKADHTAEGHKADHKHGKEGEHDKHE